MRFSKPMRFAGRSGGIMVVWAMLACSPARSPVPMVAPPGAAVPEANMPYRLVPGDVIEVKFYYNPELNEQLVVRPDGMISLQRLGEVQAGGLAPGELSERLRSLASEQLRTSEVVVIVREFAAQMAYIGGEVAAPGTVSLQGPVTVSQAVLARGGALTSARLSQALVVRSDNPGSASILEVDLRRIFRGETPDLLLQPYDIVFLPRTRISNVGLFVEHYVNNVVPRALSFPIFLNERGRIVPRF
jgi:polysaccharide biosynthesis/export protein